MFRFKKSVPVEYNRQGYIYFLSRLYEALPQEKQKKIQELCRMAAGEHHAALFAFVTSDLSATEICQKCFISRSTLERAARKYYMEFPMDF